MALFETIAQVKAALPGTVVSFNFDTIEPLLNDAEKKWLRDAGGILGIDEYEALLEAFEGDTLTPEQEELLYPCQKIAAHFAYIDWAPQGNILPTDGGFLVATSENTQIASKWRVEDFTNYLRTKGYESIEEALHILWNSDDGTFSDWETSDNHDLWRSSIILDSTTFQKHADIKHSFELFMKMKPFMKVYENFMVKSVLGAELYDEILAEVIDGDVSELNQTLLDQFLYPSIAFGTLSEAGANLSMELSALGIIEHSTGDRGDYAPVMKAADKSKVSYFISNNKRNADLYIQALTDYLNDNVADYPLFEASASFIDPDAEEDADGDPINDADSGVFFL